MPAPLAVAAAIAILTLTGIPGTPAPAAAQSRDRPIPHDAGQSVSPSSKVGIRTTTAHSRCRSATSTATTRKRSTFPWVPATGSSPDPPTADSRRICCRAGNRANPDPTQWVGWGQRSYDDMFHAHVNVVYLTDEDYEQIVAERAAASND